MERLILTFIYIMTSLSLFISCGDRGAAISILPAKHNITISKDDPKKLQMVIIADPTDSMVETQEDIKKHFPSFAQELLRTEFVFEIFCSTTSYTGTTFEEIIIIDSKDILQAQTNNRFERLVNSLSACINTELDSGQIGDERGLEAARQTWSKVIENGRLDPNAVKLTMIVTNEDDCSRDLGKYPSDDNVFNRCIDQNVGYSETEGIKTLAFPLTDTGYAGIEGLFPEIIRDRLDAPIVLFPTSRYVNFFRNELNYKTRGQKDALDEVLIQRGHIFAPVIMQPPAAVTKAKAVACSDAKTKRALSTGAQKVMSYGMRYYQVAEESGNQTYSLCDPLKQVFEEINTNVQNEVEIKRYPLPRRPLNPRDLQISIRRTILDADKAKPYLDLMTVENSKTLEENRWKMINSRTRRENNIKVETQIWERTLGYGQGFTHRPETNEIIFNNELYQPYNDKLQVLDYIPAGLDADVDYTKIQ